MIDIILDGKNMGSKEMAHLYMKWKLKSSEYHGKNLDALWDVLSTYDKSIKISLINKENLIEDLGDYGESIIETFQDAQKENDNINFEVKSV